jgi:hypothetical protein
MERFFINKGQQAGQEDAKESFRSANQAIEGHGT